MIRFVTAVVVCAMAAFAAEVGYSHIYGPSRAYGQDGTAARLLPLSVDGLILSASLVLLHEARNGRDAPGLTQFMLWLGIGATIGANIAFGARYGLLGAPVAERVGGHVRGGDALGGELPRWAARSAWREVGGIDERAGPGGVGGVGDRLVLPGLVVAALSGPRRKFFGG